MKDVFTTIYKNNTWGGRESISGNGSGDEQTATIRFEIPKLISRLGLMSMLDIPCGDFYWMNMVDLGNTEYTGMDIVEPLIKSNNEKFNIDGVQFKVGNLISDKLPKVDVIFCRDCLVHLSFEDINKALSNMRMSGSRYLLTTTFTDRDTNKNIETGSWRTLNLRLKPFNFPKPLVTINERCTEAKGKYTDKVLGLWEIKDLI